ncbi:hypothetical protein KJ652_03295 [Patescibacteria group bacterium]|nr:hypothetical protein [Patescibacteria group bacterium]MBU1123593.1 hypothetical protein [Patescibacteria group bacterium]
MSFSSEDLITFRQTIEAQIQSDDSVVRTSYLIRDALNDVLRNGTNSPLIQSFIKGRQQKLLELPATDLLKVLDTMIQRAKQVEEHLSKPPGQQSV